MGEIISVIDHGNTPFTPDPLADWIESHRAEIAPHVGQFVRINLELGVVESSDDPVVLSHNRDLTRREAVIFVAPWMYAP